MSVANLVRFLSLAVAAAALLVVLGAGVGRAGKEPAASPVRTANSADDDGAWGGRLCPREVGYGKFDQPIVLQDI